MFTWWGVESGGKSPMADCHPAQNITKLEIRSTLTSGCFLCCIVTLLCTEKYIDVTAYESV